MLNLDNDHFWTTFTVVVGDTTDIVSPEISQRMLYARKKADWKTYRKTLNSQLSQVNWPRVKGLDAWNTAICSAIRMATKKAVPYAAVVIPPG